VSAVDVPDYPLPETAIAQTPVEPRHAARLLDATQGSVVHRRVRDLPDLLAPGDVMVINTTRVMPARLRLHKPTGGASEVLLLEVDPDDPNSWTALVRPGRRLPPGTVLSRHPGGDPELLIEGRFPTGERRVRFLGPAEDLIADHGQVALPPYIRTTLLDPSRYQTVYADRLGSVAAPTAGLHLTTDLLQACRDRGVEVHHVDLAIGLATFKPIAAARAEDHVMHRERFRIPESTWAACQEASRVVAVGTTTVRALETAAATGQMEGTTDLYICPGFRFDVVDVLLTNFHLPRSSLLLLLEAFCGPRWRDLYDTALAEGYRFLSFGDAMIVGRE
jgi:S-adenosylmethionine:tRNA ribosyltransferase-isomerase